MLVTCHVLELNLVKIEVKAVGNSFSTNGFQEVFLCINWLKDLEYKFLIGYYRFERSVLIVARIVLVIE